MVFKSNLVAVSEKWIRLKNPMISKPSREMIWDEPDFQKLDKIFNEKRSLLNKELIEYWYGTIFCRNTCGVSCLDVKNLKRTLEDAIKREIRMEIESKQEWNNQILHFDPDSSRKAWKHFRKYYAETFGNKYNFNELHFFEYVNGNW